MTANELLQILATIAALTTTQPTGTAQTCGWYERIEVTPTLYIYHRYSGCDNRYIGTRTETRTLQY